MNTNNVRIIKTQFFTKRAYEVLDSVIGQLSDGWGENNPRNDRYWKFATVKTEPNGQVEIAVSTDSGEYNRSNYTSRHWTDNGFRNMTDDDVLAWFAAKIHYTMLLELKDDPEYNKEVFKYQWKRDNTEFTSCYLNHDEEITVADVHAIYDALLNKVNFTKTKHYSADQLKRVFGEPKSDADTAVEVQRRDTEKRIRDEYFEEVKKLEDAKKEAIKTAEETFNNARSEAYKKYQEAIKSIAA